MNYRFYGQFAAKDAIEPLDDRIAGVGRRSSRPTTTRWRWRRSAGAGEQLCLPQNVSSLAVYYNRDLFRKYGVAEPQPGWTWNDLVGHRAAR